MNYLTKSPNISNYSNLNTNTTNNNQPLLITKYNLSNKMSAYRARYEKSHSHIYNNPFMSMLLFNQRKYYFKRMLMIAAILVIVSIIILSLFCPERLCSSSSSNKQWMFPSNNNNNNNYFQSSYQTNSNLNYMSERLNVDRILLHKFGYDYEDFNRFKLSKIYMVDFEHLFKVNSTDNIFQKNGTDVLVFLHMQKTGGSAFDRHLVRDLILPQPCKCDSKRKKKCRCFRPGTTNKYWLFSRYSIGWKCGLHADYTELTNCVDRILNLVEHPDKSKISLRPIEKRRSYYFMTLLRNPIARFLSEFKHVQRGATWKTSRHWCDGRLPTSKEVPLCFHGQNWRNVTFEEFTSCPHNLAFNRQTRMLADLSLVGCYNRSMMTEQERDTIMLFSAKQNLLRMAFFGLCEEQLATQYMFERVFHQKFKRPFVQFNQTHSHEAYASLDAESIELIKKLNHLDLELYSYAKQLFRERFARIAEKDKNFNEYFQNLIESSQIQFEKNKLAKQQKQQQTIPIDGNQNQKLTSQIISKNNHHSNVIINNIENTIEDLYDEETSPIMDSIDENDSVEDYYVR